MDTRSRALRERYAEAAAAERAEVAANVRRAGADHVVLRTSGEWLRPPPRRARQAREAGDLVTLRLAVHAVGLVPCRSCCCCDLLARRRRAPLRDRVHERRRAALGRRRARRRGAATCRSRCSCCALAALVVGLARPERAVSVARKQATVILAMDTSGSMVAKDVAPTRLRRRDGRGRAVRRRAARRRTRSASCRSRRRASVAVAPTSDHAQVKTALAGLRAERRHGDRRRDHARRSRSGGPPARPPASRRRWARRAPGA